ncbi:MAG: HEPN domain-containing protein [Planctomycetes bacterium]|nr:HEPN domain-containing protein [Planctomycetota bacterium]
MSSPSDLERMFNKARRYLASADALRTGGDYDSAVSRLYYAMFYCAEALLTAKGQTYTSHRGVLSGLAQHFIKTGLLRTDMHRWLREAFEKRQISEYDFAQQADDSEVARLQTLAEEFVIQAEGLLKKEGYL